MYCILTKYTVADQMLKFGGRHIFLGGFTAATRYSANPDVRRRRLGRLHKLVEQFERSGHKGSKTNYFRFGHFYTTRKVSTSPAVLSVLWLAVPFSSNKQCKKTLRRRIVAKVSATSFTNL